MLSYCVWNIHAFELAKSIYNLEFILRNQQFLIDATDNDELRYAENIEKVEW